MNIDVWLRENPEPRQRDYEFGTGEWIAVYRLWLIRFHLFLFQFENKN
jgi:hypothetical protein